jgi:hypothetical protein
MVMRVASSHFNEDPRVSIAEDYVYLSGTAVKIALHQLVTESLEVARRRFLTIFAEYVAPIRCRHFFSKAGNSPKMWPERNLWKVRPKSLLPWRESLGQFECFTRKFFDVHVFEGKHTNRLHKSIGSVNIPNPNIVHF